MKKQLAICAGLLLLGFGTAEAQPVYAGPGLSDPVLPPYEIMSIVRSTGLAPLTRPMRRGPYYVLVAVDRVGRQMRVVVDAQLGDIVNLRPALAAGSYGPEVTRPNGLPAVPPPDATAATAPYGARPSDNTLPSAPPRSIPNVANNPRAANPPAAAPSVTLPPTRMAVAEPALPPPPPLPRPRPKLALNEAPAASAPAETLVGRPAAKPSAPATPSAVPAAPPAAPRADDADQPIE